MDAPSHFSSAKSHNARAECERLSIKVFSKNLANNEESVDRGLKVGARVILIDRGLIVGARVILKNYVAQEYGEQ